VICLILLINLFLPPLFGYRLLRFSYISNNKKKREINLCEYQVSTPSYLQVISRRIERRSLTYSWYETHKNESNVENWYSRIAVKSLFYLSF